MRFLPHVTVATIIEDQGRFLIVEELKNNQAVLNLPAGHLEPEETLLEAAIRETREETQWEVKLTAVIGIYLYTANDGITYQRICFAANKIKHHPESPLDAGIIRSLWLTKQEIEQEQHRWRNPLMARCINDYLSGEIFPLSIIRH